jgi:hypothetical protein
MQFTKDIEAIILERIDNPGWLTTRGVLLDPSGKSSEEEHRRVEEVMKRLSAEGKVTLWRLILQNDDSELMAAARPGMELDKDLESRGAWAKAVPYAEKE